jgi:translation initiation factor IF-3
VGYVEANPKQDGRNMLMVLAPHRRKSDASRKPQAESEVDDDVDVDA